MYMTAYVTVVTLSYLNQRSDVVEHKCVRTVFTDKKLSRNGVPTKTLLNFFFLLKIVIVIVTFL